MSCENQVTSGTFPPSHRTSSQQYREHGRAVGGQEGGGAAPIEEVESPRRPDFGRLSALLAQVSFVYIIQKWGAQACPILSPHLWP